MMKNPLIRFSKEDGKSFETRLSPEKQNFGPKNNRIKSSRKLSFREMALPGLESRNEVAKISCTIASFDGLAQRLSR